MDGSNGSSFEVEKAALIGMLSSDEEAGEEGKISLLVKVFAWATGSMVRELPHAVSCLDEGRLTEEQEHYLSFESAVYLFFNSDVWSFSFGQTDDSRTAFEDIIWQYVMGYFTSKDESISDLIQERLDEYTRSYHSESRMYNPPSVLLNHLKVLADTGTVNRSKELALYSAHHHAIDLVMIQQMQCFYIFLRCLNRVFTATTDISELTAHQMKQILLTAVRTATPKNFSSREEVEEKLLGHLAKAMSAAQ